MSFQEAVRPHGLGSWELPELPVVSVTRHFL